MDENNNIENNENANNENNRWETPPEQQPPQKENPFKNWRFYAAYFAIIILPCVISFILTRGDFWGALVIISLISIPYGVGGLIAWAIVRKKNRAVALGILLGGVTPTVIACIALGGCALMLLTPM